MTRRYSQDCGLAHVKIPWMDWSDALPVSEQERDVMAAEVMTAMQDGRTHTDMATGDTVIVALRWPGGRIQIYDCIIRREAEITP